MSHLPSETETLVDRLRMRYAMGPMVNGEPEFGWREMSGPAPDGCVLPTPLMLEAAREIEQLREGLVLLREWGSGYADPGFPTTPYGERIEQFLERYDACVHGNTAGCPGNDVAIHRPNLDGTCSDCGESTKTRSQLDGDEILRLHSEIKRLNLHTDALQKQIYALSNRYERLQKDTGEFSEEERKALVTYHEFHSRQMPEPARSMHKARAEYLKRLPDTTVPS